MSALGVLYVLEGSSLGAKLLRRDADKLGFDAHFGARHLAKQDSASWKDFVARLDQCTAEDLASATEAAHATFAMATKAMQWSALE